MGKARMRSIGGGQDEGEVTEILTAFGGCGNIVTSSQESRKGYLAGVLVVTER